MSDDLDPIEQAAATAFTALRNRAKTNHGGNTQVLLVVYAVESFLRRLSQSPYAHQMVVKGGVLMAVEGIRRVTKDADLSTHGLANDHEVIRDVVTAISAIVPAPHDGIVIDADSLRTEKMREDAEYHGIRCKLVAQLGNAQIPFALDFSFGDPRRFTPITLESVIGQPSISLDAYPLTLNLAEKIVTAMQRRETSTRDRDFADLWVTSRLHDLSARGLREHIVAVAEHREQPVIPMAVALASMPDRQQAYRRMVDRMSYLHPPPDRWTDVIADVMAFVDPLLEDTAGALTHWDHATLRWVPAQP